MMNMMVTSNVSLRRLAGLACAVAVLALAGCKGGGGAEGTASEPSATTSGSATSTTNAPASDATTTPADTNKVDGSSQTDTNSGAATSPGGSDSGAATSDSDKTDDGSGGGS